MSLRVLRVGVGVLLAASGVLMCLASWQRWAGACPWVGGGGRCDFLQDHRYDFIAPTAPWEPVGDAAQLAGWSMLVLALAFVPLPWALTGRRPGVVSAVAWAGAVLGLAAVGVATLRAGLAGTVVHPILPDLTLLMWGLVTPALLVRFAIDSRGWPLAAAVSTVLSTPLVATFSYAVGPYDARPWWEAISGLLTVAAGVCLLGSAVLSSPTRARGGGARHSDTEGPSGRLGRPVTPAEHP